MLVIYSEEATIYKNWINERKIFEQSKKLNVVTRFHISKQFLFISLLVLNYTSRNQNIQHDDFDTYNALPKGQ